MENTLASKQSSRLSPILISTLLTLNFIFFVVYKASDYFTGFGFNEAVIYHVFYGIQGFDISLYLEFIIGLVIAIILFAYLSFTIPQKFLRKTHYFFSIIALLILLFFQPLTNNLFTLFGSPILNRTFVGDLHPVINERIVINNKRNIVYIYAESLEKTYLDQSILPNLTPNLLRLYRQGLTFSNVQQTYGAGGTMAGMVASQCAVPFDSYGIVDKSQPFLPSLYCLGDILSENNYNLSYMGGASLKFAGKGNFYRSHHFNKVQGKDELLPLLDDKNYVSHWGLHDDFLFELISKEYNRLNQLDKKFGLFMLTLDTHHPDYEMSKICDSHQYGDGRDDKLNAIHCSDYQIGEFVKTLRQSKNKPLIIIASDHLSPNSKVFKGKLKNDMRTNLLIVLNSGFKPIEISKASTTLDVLPTLLSLLGTDVEAHNLGISMFSEKPSLLSSYPKLNQMLIGWTHQLRKFN